MQTHHFCEKNFSGILLDCTSKVLSLPPVQPLLILSPLLRTPKNAGVTQHFCPLSGPREGRGEVATSDFVPFCLGIPKNARVTWHFRPLLGPQESKGEAATSDFVPLCWGTLLILRPFVGDHRECNLASHFLSLFFYSHALLRGPLSWG